MAKLAAWRVSSKTWELLNIGNFGKVATVTGFNFVGAQSLAMKLPREYSLFCIVFGVLN